MKIKKMKIGVDVQTLIDAYPAPTALLDRNGMVEVVNTMWRESTGKAHGFFGRTYLDENYFHLLGRSVEKGNDDALKIILGLRQVLETGNRFVYSYGCMDGQTKKWYKIIIKPVSGQLEGCIVIHEDISELVMKNSALRESKELYEKQFNESLLSILISSPEGEIVEGNPASAELLGYDYEELQSLQVNELFDLTDPDTARGLRRLKLNGEVEGEFLLVDKSGQKIPVEISAKIYRREAGEMRHLFMFRDISARKQAEDLLAVEKRFNDTALNSLPGLFVVLDIDGRLHRWNKGYSEELGYGEEDDKVKNIFEIVSKNDHKKIRKALDEAFYKGGGEVQASLLHKDGTERTYKLRGNPFDSKNNSYIVITGIDITMNVQMKREKEVNYELMSQLFGNAPNAIVLVDEENRVERANSQFETMFGFSEKEITGENVDDLIVPENQIEEAAGITGKILEGYSGQFETTRSHKDGDEIPVLLGSVPVQLNGKFVAAYGIYVDMRNQKRLENEITDLYKKEKAARIKLQKTLNEKEILLQEVHHRVKNNLAVITGLMDLQLMETEDEELASKLKKLQRRVFSIAQIHEVIYQVEDLVQVRFDEYMETMIESCNDELNRDNIDAQMDLSRVDLNLNQAVSCGLLINELISILSSSEPNSCCQFKFGLSEKNGEVAIWFDNFDPSIDSLEGIGEYEPLELKLAEVLLKQLGADFRFEEMDNSRKLIITFEKMNVKGSSSRFL